MILLTPSSAQYFCQKYSASASTTACSVDDFIKKSKISLYTEGNPSFDELKDCLLRESERCLFLSKALHGCSLRFLNSSSSWWAIVTYYYSSFYAAKSLLALHGGYKGDKFWIEIQQQSKGSLAFKVHKSIHPAANNCKGSHRHFWKVFYTAVASLSNYVTPSLVFALQPMMTDTWLIDTRNKYNYDSNIAINFITNFHSNFNPATFPNCINSPLNTMQDIALSISEIVSTFRNQYNLNTDVLSNFPPNLQGAIDDLIKVQRDNSIETFAITQLGLISE